jgi:hypothetical protein
MPVLDMYFNCKELGGEHMTIASAVIAVVGVLVMHGRSSYFRIFYQIINHDGWELSFKSLSDRETWTDTIDTEEAKQEVCNKQRNDDMMKHHLIYRLLCCD